jgi:hypothetical protein
MSLAVSFLFVEKKKKQTGAVEIQVGKPGLLELDGTLKNRPEKILPTTNAGREEIQASDCTPDVGS